MDSYVNCIDINKVTDKKVLCLVDGDHYPDVTLWAIDLIRKHGGDVVSVLFLSSGEKVIDPYLQLRSERNDYVLYIGNNDLENTLKILKIALSETCPEIVVDISDEPLLNYQDRFRIASTLLHHGISYLGSDFSFEPPQQHDIMEKPSISVVGTGKRVGKTAVNIMLNRILDKNGFDPVVVAMGRGGPKEPVILKPDKMELSSEYLIKISEKGIHAASDHWEGAYLAGVPTIGCKRAGGGMAGNPFASNVTTGATIANSMPHKIVIFEGSGPSYPPVKTDCSIVVVGAGQPLDNIINYLGEYRILSSDMAIVTMCEFPIASNAKIKKISNGILNINPEIKLALTIFRPQPFSDINGKNIFLATTASESMKSKIINYLENTYDCRISGYTSHLSNRPLLKRDIEKNMIDADMLLTEIKAASIDIAAKMAQKKGIETTFYHNNPLLVGGTVDDLQTPIIEICKKAITSFENRKTKTSC